MCTKRVWRVWHWAICVGEKCWRIWQHSVCAGQDFRRVWQGKHVQRIIVEGMTQGSLCRRGVGKVWQWAICVRNEFQRVWQWALCAGEVFWYASEQCMQEACSKRYEKMIMCGWGVLKYLTVFVGVKSMMQCVVGEKNERMSLSWFDHCWVINVVAGDLSVTPVGIGSVFIFLLGGQILQQWKGNWHFF